MVGMCNVAEAVGVFSNTASLVVDDTGYISADMRAKVEPTMHQLSYIPNELARNLYQNRANTIGMIMPTVARLSFSTLTAHLQREFATYGLKTPLCSIADVDEGEAEYVNMLQRHMMNSIIIATYTEHPADYWISIHRPVAAPDRTFGEDVPAVWSDHKQGGRLIARQLIDSGTCHMVLVDGPCSQFAAATTFPTIHYHLTVERLLVDAGIVCDYMEAGAVANIAVHEATACAIFEQYPDVDAIVGSDAMASVTLQEASRRGIEVPADLQVITYGGTLMAETADKRLAAIRQNFPAIAAVFAIHMDSQTTADGGPTSSSKNDSASDVGTQPTSEEVIPIVFIPSETTR